MCLKYSDKWSKEHKCKLAQAFLMIDDEPSDEEPESNKDATSQEINKKRPKLVIHKWRPSCPLAWWANLSLLPCG